MTVQAKADPFESALASFRAGNSAHAAARCDEILRQAPAHSGANHLLGVIHLLGGDPVKAESLIKVSLSSDASAQGQADLGLALKAQKRYEEAEIVLRRAIALEPRLFHAHLNLARVFDEQRKFGDAEAAYRRVIELKPDAADIRFNLGKLLARVGRSAEAEVELRRAAELRPAWAEAHNSLGAVLAERGSSDEAEAAFRRALEITPRFPEASCNLGLLLVERRRFEEAEATLRFALSVDPEFAGASEGLANLLSRLGRAEEAIEEFRRSVALSPNNLGDASTLGALLAERKHFEEAESVLRRALELDPEFVPAHVNLGSLLIDVGRLDEGERHLRSVLEVDPSHWAAVYNLGLLLKSLRRHDESEKFHRRAVELKPRWTPAHIGLGNALLAKNSGDISEALDCYRRASELDPDCLVGHSNLAYALTFVSSTGLEVLEESKRFAARFEAPYATGPMKYENERSLSRRLRIGYVSPDFRHHCQTLFTLPLLRNHDHEAFEIYCYASVAKPDHATREIQPLADVWRDVHTLSDDKLAKQIKEDRIDVLVDLTMHMANGRQMMFAHRPAPVQVAWLAYPGTTGSNAIGYRLTDPWIDPPGSPEADNRYSEQSIRLPDTFWCYDPLTQVHEVSPLPADSAGHITFGCLNNPCKLTNRTFDLWAQVMARVEGSTLLLLVSHGEAREAVVAHFAAWGIAPERLNFVDYQPRERYLNRYQHIDIVLDTFPYNGHTTSLDALWMGVPVATMVGETPAARAGYALLSNLGLSELAGDSDESFVTKTVQLSNDLPRLRRIRSELRTRMESSPLMDGARFARGIETAFRSMYGEWVRSTTAQGDVRSRTRRSNRARRK
ncbi:tetratricopeptide repeat protein [Caballeronia insecticola]|uniref:tetratricopeptide repeat protein n=1 Tax=Caballeronia insecticola TaxID=758793 RepID=UPI00068507C5|nr:tetratricopeptide repeat protein [Caballeronia insecticola]